MLDRLISFLKSGNKQIQLKYFLNERKAGFEKWTNRHARHAPFLLNRSNGKVNLAGQTSRLYGLHRSGWNYAMSQLTDLHNPRGIILDAFIDNTFSERHHGFKGYKEPWTGFIHIPPGVPDWFNSNQSNHAVFNSDAWKRSAPYCKGLFTLSGYHKKYLESQFDFIVENLFHPVEFPELTWNYERFVANKEKKIVQTGWWLRRAYSIYLMEITGYRKTILLKQDADMKQHLKLELEHTDANYRINSDMFESVTEVKFLPNKKYDQLLSENIVFLDLIDSSANNAIIECIARNTPILVNPIEPVTEYLGVNYPFYFNSLEEAAKKAEDMDLVRETHLYLVNYPLKKKLTGAYFRESFLNSSIYQAL